MDFFIEQNRSTRAEKRFLYLNYVKPMVDREALFADGTEEYVKMSGEKPHCVFVQQKIMSKR